jgi:hypothetical protein
MTTTKSVHTQLEMFDLTIKPETIGELIQAALLRKTPSPEVRIINMGAPSKASRSENVHRGCPND